MIKLTITTKAGTTVSLDIPEVDSVEVNKQLHEALSGVDYPEYYYEASEGAIPVVSEDLKPSGKRYKSVGEMLVAQGLDEINARVNATVEKMDRANATREKMEEGEVGGEEGGCKGEEGEVEGKEEEKPERIYDLDHSVETALDLFQFPCETGIYTPPMELTRDFVLAFGEEHVTKEFLKARSWLIANPQKRKTQRGMGRFLNAWLCREAGMKRTPIKETKSPKIDSLLHNGTEDSQGW